MQRSQRGREPINNVTQLIGKDVYVKPGKHYERLVNLNKELGGGIRIHQVTTDSLTAEDLIGQVAQGAIPYTVADNNLAQLNRTYYANLNIDLAISYDQRSSWAVRRDCPLLAEAADSWQRQNTQSSAYRASAKRYFEIGKQMPHTPILSLQEGKISHYDGLFKKYAPLIRLGLEAVSIFGLYGVQLRHHSRIVGRGTWPHAAYARNGSCNGHPPGKRAEPRRKRPSRRKIHRG